MNKVFQQALMQSALFTPSALAFGVVIGVLTAAMGYDVAHALAMAGLINSAATQLVILQLLAEQTPLVLIILTLALMSARFTIYSASIAPHMQNVGGWKFILPYSLGDHIYALSTHRFTALPVLSPHEKVIYYLTITGMILCFWLVGNYLGARFGLVLPDDLYLHFIMPLVFLSLLVPTLKTKPAYTAMIVAGSVSLIGQDWPFSLGLLTAIFSGLAAGAIHQYYDSTSAEAE